MKSITVFNRDKFRNWLVKNHSKEDKVAVIVYRKHTGRSAPTHKELMEEAICYGWIDTTLKKLDDSRYVRHFSKRNKNSRWSDNTRRYAKELIEQKRMTSFGLKIYKEGLKKPTFDSEIPKNPPMPDELKNALGKNKKARENFGKFPPSTKKMMYRWILRAKREETIAKRVKIIVENSKVGKKDVFSTQQKVNL